MLSNRSYLTSPQHCNLHNMSLFMAREGPGITSTRDQVVKPTGASFSFGNGKGVEGRWAGFRDIGRNVQDRS